MPVLQATQVSKAVLSALVYYRVFIDPACAGCIGADRRMHVLRKTSAYLLQVFDDPRARPVKIGAVLKNHVDVGVSEHGLCANSLHMRSGEQAGDNRIGYLVFDNIRRLT